MFRRDAKLDIDWKRWIEAHRAELLECGIPVVVLSDRRNWELFLEDGSFSSVPGSPPDIDVDELPKDRARRLLDILGASFPERSKEGTSHFRAINRLEYLLRRGAHGA
jgi:hypothetical protein